MNNENLRLFGSTLPHVYECSKALAGMALGSFKPPIPREKLPIRFSEYHPKRQLEYLAGRHCAMQALTMLSTHRQILIRDKILTVGENRVPNWPDHVRGSISHSDHVVGAFAASAKDYLGVGLDFETMMTDERAQRLARRICTTTEWRQCQDSATAALPIGWWVTLTFSAKESLYKAIYPLHQEFVGFQQVELTAIAPGAKTFDYRFLIPLKNPLPTEGQGVFRQITTEDSGTAVETMATAIAVPTNGSGL